MSQNRAPQWQLHRDSGKRYRTGRDRSGRRCYQWEDGSVTYPRNSGTSETPQTTVTNTGSALLRGSHASTTLPLYGSQPDQYQYTYSASLPNTNSFHARNLSGYSTGSDQSYANLGLSRDSSYEQAISDDSSSAPTLTGPSHGNNPTSPLFAGSDSGAALASGLAGLSLDPTGRAHPVSYDDSGAAQQGQQNLHSLMPQSQYIATVSTGHRTDYDPAQQESSAVHANPGRVTQRVVVPIRATEGYEEKLDPRYFKQSDPRNFFRIGRIFAMLWHEEAGSQGTVLTPNAVAKGRYGEPIYGTIRRMAVVREGQGACWCIPITTYNNRGTSKPGLTREAIEAHTIIHMSTEQPARLQAERYMIKKPIAVLASDARQKLDRMSRINFSKVYTVEHYVKVMNVGMVTNDSMPYFSAYWTNFLNGT